MIDFVIAYDNEDETLGEFFEWCGSEIKEIAQSFDSSIIELRRKELNPVLFDIEMSKIAHKAFIISVYSHGHEHQLVSDASYLSIDSDLTPFKNSLFYTFSCLTGVRLGPKLIENGCKAFVGYKVPAHVVLNNFDIFSESSNYGLKQFLSGINLGQSVKNMKDKHTELIDESYEKYPLVAAMLRRNRDGLVLYGEPNLKILFFINDSY